MKDLIYLDYTATSPMRPEVADAMSDFYINKFGNPSSIHAMGREARAAVDQARWEIAEILGCDEQEIYFTSGGTESDNLVITGVIEAYKSQNNQKLPHIIISNIEHAAIYKNVKKIEERGAAKVTYLPVNQDGFINIDDLKAAIRPETILVSVMYVNNEIGAVEPIRQIGELLKMQNEKRKTQNLRNIIFHTDAVQAAGYFPLDTRELYLDALTLSAHKFGGPKGVGLLYVKKDIVIMPLIVGGEQELALRPGTENVAGIVGMARALSLTTKESQDGADKKILDLRNYFEDELLKILPETLIIGREGQRSPAISGVVFPGMEGAMIVMKLDLAGVCVSSGAACSSGSLKISHVIEALKLVKPYDGGAVRFSFSLKTTKDEINKTLSILAKIVKER